MKQTYYRGFARTAR